MSPITTREWGVPEFDDRALYEKLILDGFQAGLSWITILRKRENFRRAFSGFDPAVIAAFGPEHVEALMCDAGIVRNRQKILGTIAGARAWLAIQERQGFATFLWGFVDGRPVQNNLASRADIRPENETSRAISKALKAEGFNFVGPTIVYAFMQAVGMVNDHLTGCFRHARGEGAWASAWMSAKAPRAWQRMLSGRRLDLLDPSPLDIEIEDIAHGLARVARWNGQTVGDHIFSVAQHSLLVEAVGAHLRPDLATAARLTLLLHDAAEYVLGDVISPFKAVIGDTYKDVEARLTRAIYLRFGLPAEPSAELTRALKRADRLAAFHEATRLAGFARAEALKFFGRPDPLPDALDAAFAPWPIATAQARYLERFQALTEDARVARETREAEPRPA